MKKTLLFLSFIGLLNMEVSLLSSGEIFDASLEEKDVISSVVHLNGVKEEVVSLPFYDERQKFTLLDGSNHTYDIELIERHAYTENGVQYEPSINVDAMNRKKEQNRQEVFRKYLQKIK